MNAIDLQDRNAIVTGAAQGIGLAVAHRFLQSGARVCLWDQDAALLPQARRALAAEFGEARVSAQVVNQADWPAVEGAARATQDALGALDILVNNAGIAGANATVANYDVAEWRRVIDIDLHGVFFCCKAVVPFMVERGYGRIVNVASIAGKEGNPNASAYSAAKAGVIALTKSLGKELAAHDIAVNCITPATANTRILEQLTPQFIEYMLSRIPRGRFLKVEEAAAMIAWLASAENSFTTGAVFDLSGGRATY